MLRECAKKEQPPKIRNSTIQTEYWTERGEATHVQIRRRRKTGISVLHNETKKRNKERKIRKEQKKQTKWNKIMYRMRILRCVLWSCPVTGHSLTHSLSHTHSIDVCAYTRASVWAVYCERVFFSVLINASLSFYLFIKNSVNLFDRIHHIIFRSNSFRHKHMHALARRWLNSLVSVYSTKTTKWNETTATPKTFTGRH